MIKNLGYKILSLSLTIIIVIIVIAYSPSGYEPTLCTTTTLDFANTAAGSATDLTVTVNGAVDGNPVTLGVPNASVVANGFFVAWVSAANTVTVRYINPNLLTALNPASGSFKIIVHKK